MLSRFVMGAWGLLCGDGGDYYVAKRGLPSKDI